MAAEKAPHVRWSSYTLTQLQIFLQSLFPCFPYKLLSQHKNVSWVKSNSRGVKSNYQSFPLKREVWCRCTSCEVLALTQRTTSVSQPFICFQFCNFVKVHQQRRACKKEGKQDSGSRTIPEQYRFAEQTDIKKRVSKKKKNPESAKILFIPTNAWFHSLDHFILVIKQLILVFFWAEILQQHWSCVQWMREYRGAFV